jgi:hypothetical protein
MGKTSVIVNGAVRASGGRGGNGDTSSTVGKGGGGGGGGGIIHLLSSSTPTVTGTIDVSPGAGGSTAQGTGQAVTAGGGGGACGGNGGDAGATLVAPAAGTAGYDLRTVVPAPENLFL